MDKSFISKNFCPILHNAMTDQGISSEFSEAKRLTLILAKPLLSSCTGSQPFFNNSLIPIKSVELAATSFSPSYSPKRYPIVHNQTRLHKSLIDLGIHILPTFDQQISKCGEPCAKGPSYSFNNSSGA